MYINRRAETSVTELLKEFPIVGLLGARQVGKTTLAKKIATLIDRDSIYLDLELIEHYNRLETPEYYLRGHKDKLVIIDEVQRKPELFPVIRGLVDEYGNNGHFLFLGSASPELLKQSSETLAGRIYYEILAPFSCSEVDDWNKLWYRGGFPDGYLSKTDKTAYRWLSAFITTYLERDLPALGLQVPSIQLRRFWEMLAHNNGQMLNLSKYASNFGISPHTIKRYLSILESTFLVRQLKPYFSNATKRLVKTPKIYIRDTGLLHVLLRIDSTDSLAGHPIVGASYEGWIIEQICANLDPDFQQTYFYRTHAGAEIDLLIESSSGLTAIEVKRSLAPKASRGLIEVMKDLNLNDAYIVYPGDETYRLTDKVTAITLKDLLPKVSLSH